jgi:hypothetical protein
MSIVEELHAAHKARLQRLSPAPVKPAWQPIVVSRNAPKPQAHDAGWENMWFHDLVTGHSKEPRTVLVREIQEAVCKHYDVSIVDMLSGRRTASITFPRQIAMYLCRVMTKHGFAEIGRRFGGRDHTTVIHGSQKIAGLYGFDVRVTCDVNSLKKVLA